VTRKKPAIVLPTQKIDLTKRLRRVSRCALSPSKRSILVFTIISTHLKYSKGRKVTGMHLTNNSEALITTADSRLRLLNLDV